MRKLREIRANPKAIDRFEDETLELIDSVIKRNG